MNGKRRVALVTGGMGGIGTAICRRLCATDHVVIAGCGPGSQRRERWLAEMRAEGHEVYSAAGNVADWDSTRDAIERARRRGAWEGNVYRPDSFRKRERKDH